MNSVAKRLSALSMLSPSHRSSKAGELHLREPFL